MADNVGRQFCLLGYGHAVWYSMGHTAAHCCTLQHIKHPPELRLGLLRRVAPSKDSMGSCAGKGAPMSTTKFCTHRQHKSYAWGRSHHFKSSI
jgi:hypothetical protein